MAAAPTRSYPLDLAARVRARWPAEALPLPQGLEALLGIAYHASFLRDEERPVVCRVLFVAPSELPTNTGPPVGLLPLVFETARAYAEHELRRLSAAADTHRAFVGVCEESSQLRIWGVVQSGPRWLQVAQGGRAEEPPVPPALVVRVVRPGHLLVGCGGRTIAELRGGQLSDAPLDVFQSQWLPARFEQARALMASEHTEMASPALDPTSAAALTGYFAQQMVKRVIATIRASRHGGAIVLVPPSTLAEGHLQLKYAIAEGPARGRFRMLVLEMLEAIARLAASANGPPFELYRASTVPRIAELDEGLFELGHLVASLAMVDGAVVVTKRFEVLGFGAEIGALPTVAEVRRATDLEGDRYLVEPVDAVGTRHRSAYRLCAESPETVAIVVSQDGGVRFVAQHRGAVTSWDHGLGAD
jgi:hypothetical protein